MEYDKRSESYQQYRTKLISRAEVEFWINETDPLRDALQDRDIDTLADLMDWTYQDYLYEFEHDDVVDVPDGKEKVWREWDEHSERFATGDLENQRPGFTPSFGEKQKVRKGKLFPEKWKSVHRKVKRWRANVRENLRGPD